MKNKSDIVYNILQQMLENSPERSYKRLNPALRSTLDNCIEADLPFQPNTFSRIYNELRGGWWFGDGSGSSIGEGFYNTACGCNHASAQQSFEAFAERPGVLWEENIGTPSRLHVGAKFTWKGEFLTVTSMRADSLVACSYKGYRDNVRGMKPGAIFYCEGGSRLVTSAKKQGNAEIIRVIKAPPGHDSREILHRLTIKYSDIQEFRRTAKARVKAMVDLIGKCDPEKDGARLAKEVNASHFRHFEMEEINRAVQRRKKLLAQEDAISTWRKGKGEQWIASDLILLRLIDGRVECSNGNSVSADTVRAVLPVVLANRHKSARLDVPLDSYTVNNTAANGVKIGCTLVPWEEIELIAPQLKTA